MNYTLIQKEELMKQTKSSENVDDLYAKAVDYITRYLHSSRGFYRAVLNALPPLKINGEYNAENIELAIKVGKIFDSLGESSRTWNVSKHWIFTVCLPKIIDPANPKYSPIYKQHATKLPLNRFGELERLVTDESGNLVPIRDKLVGDDRFIGNGCEDYGSAWDDNGEVIKRDANGHPILDGFIGWIARHVDNIQEICCRSPNRDRHFAGFMIGHTRDDEDNKRNGEVEHKAAHVHVLVDMPTKRTRYRMMELFGYPFDDLTKTFNWISQTDDQRNERIEAFLGTLQGAMQNYIVTKHYVASLQYLVHQSSKAKRDQKTPYAVNEVISWLPDDPGKSYSSIAGVYDDEMVAEGVDAAIIRNLHSHYNTAHHTARLVGRNEGDRVFTYHQLAKLRSLGTKGTGRMNFSKRSKKLILDQLMDWIYSGKMQVTDWKEALHGAFNDSDAAGLIADQDFIKRLTAVMDDQRESTISDINANRNMTTIFITAAQGGIGKSYLASRLCQYLEKGRTPYMTAAEDKGKTVDYWQDYQDQKAAVIDEVSPSSIEWGALKDMLDPHKIPRVASRYHNTSPWNLNLLIMTNVYSDGIAGYIRDVLHYAPGVGKLGYFDDTSNEYSPKSWQLKKHDAGAGQTYLSQLSQLLRRLPINIHLSPANKGKGTEVTVSILNFRPGGRAIQHYDYVYTRDSDHVFNKIINEDLSDQDMEHIVKTVVKMIKNVRAKAKSVFEKDPNTILNETNGFLEQHAYFGVYIQDGLPWLDEEEHVDNNDDNSGMISAPVATPQENMLTKLSKIRYELWPEFANNNPYFKPELNQFKALMSGYVVPLYRGYGDDWIVVRLSKKATKLLADHQLSKIILHLNSIDSIDDNDDLFDLGHSKEVARILSDQQ